jgi:Asp/Glu/hydantoin racemase
LTAIALLNPNTDSAVTRRKAAVAQAACPAEVQVVGFTVALDAPLITDERQLAEAAPAVVAVATTTPGMTAHIERGIAAPGVGGQFEAVFLPGRARRRG